MNQYQFLNIYRDISKGLAHPDDVTNTYWDLKFNLNDNITVGRYFNKPSPTHTEMAFALDAVAHHIHRGNNSVLKMAFPGGDKDLFKTNLDENLYEMRNNNNGGGMSTLLATGGMIFLEKAQIGMTTKDDIVDAIHEYEKLALAGIATPAELLTLHRFYKDKRYLQSIREQDLHKEENEPLVVGGPASIVMVDNEGHLITAPALKKAFNDFMQNVRTRNANVYHSDVQAGWILPAYISKTGRIYKSGVSKDCLWVVSEVRNDTRVAQRLSEEIEKGTIRCYSIGGSAIKTKYNSYGSQSFLQVDELELQEITFCEQGVNQGAHFDILKSSKSIEQYQINDIIDSILPLNKDLPNDLLFWDEGNIIIKADRSNSITDAWILKTKKLLPDNINILVKEDVSINAQLLSNIKKRGDDTEMKDELEKFSNFLQKAKGPENTPHEVTDEEDRKTKLQELAIWMGMPHSMYAKNPMRKNKEKTNATPYRQQKDEIKGRDPWQWVDTGLMDEDE